MPKTFAQKALARAAGHTSVAVGEILDVEPAIVLSHDNTAAIIELFREIGATRVRYADRLAITLDHAVPAPTAEHARNHAEIRRFIAEQQIAHFFEAGRGICHQVVSEEALVLPGSMILGADSHSTHFGWLGAFGAGIGRSEAAALWATGKLWLRVPETIRIDLSGQLPFGVTAKDLSLWTLRLLGDEAGIYCALEFGGIGLSGLTLESRMVIPNMMAESGAKNAYLEPDVAVFRWLALRLSPHNADGIEERMEAIAAAALYPDPGAAYNLRMELDLSTLEPLVALPHHPANVVPVSEVAGTPVQQAFLGTCTNGRLEDLAAAAQVLSGPGGHARRLAPGTRMLVIPASSEVLQDAISAGHIQVFLEAGAMIGTPGCGPCMGNHLGVPAAGESVISSANRNFRGRMGNPDSQVYLASPAVVAASAVTGRITDPRDLMPEAARSRRPLRGLQAAGSQPRPVGGARPAQGADIACRTGTAPLASLGGPCGSKTVFSGRAWVYGDHVNTDVIFPGKYTYSVPRGPEMAGHALEDLYPDFASQVCPGDIVVGGRNWGCGSSREQAVWCLLEAGIRIVIAASFARIYYRNAINNGLLPITCPAAAAAIQPGELVDVDVEDGMIRCAAGEFNFPALSESATRILEARGLVPMLQATIRKQNAEGNAEVEWSPSA